EGVPHLPGGAASAAAAAPAPSGGHPGRAPASPVHIIATPSGTAAPGSPAAERTGGINPVDTATARKRLEQMRDSIDRSIAVLKAEPPAAEGTAGYPDPADAAADLSEADRTLAALQAAQSQRSQVLEAMDRLAAGRYGICTECGRPVPEGRLEAR